MEVQVVSDGQGRFILSCPSQMEWHARVNLVDRVRAATDGKPFDAIILDLGNVSYINSAGLGAIFNLRKFVTKAGAKLAIARPRAAIQRLLTTVNVQAIVPVVATLDEARQCLANEGPDAGNQT